MGARLCPVRSRGAWGGGSGSCRGVVFAATFGWRDLMNSLGTVFNSSGLVCSALVALEGASRV
eukprot:1991247-Pyramimonas_sp.AAC.1